MPETRILVVDDDPDIHVLLKSILAKAGYVVDGVSDVVTDSMCKSNHAMMQKGANKMSDHDCTVACVKMMGQKYVLAAGDKVYQIDNQNFAGLEKDAGMSVMAVGQVSPDGKSITLTKISPAAAK